MPIKDKGNSRQNLNLSPLLELSKRHFFTFFYSVYLGESHGWVTGPQSDGVSTWISRDIPCYLDPCYLLPGSALHQGLLLSGSCNRILDIDDAKFHPYFCWNVDLMLP